MNAPTPPRLPLLLAGLAVASLLLLDTSRAHGGAYRGPSSTGAGGGGGSPPADAVPASGGAGSGGGASTGQGGRPAVPGAPGSQPGTGTGGARPSGPSTGGAIAASEDDWTQWWELNKDRYLDLKTRLYSYDITPGSAGFFLGGWPAAFVKDSLRPSRAQIRDRVVPALEAALASETHNEILTGCLIALAKAGRTEDEATARGIADACRPFLADKNQEIAETAALALGILGHDAAVDDLAALLLDTERARKDLVHSSRVHYRTRAFAAYGLSMIGSRTRSDDVRAEVVATLFKALRTDTSGTKDVRVAALVALGRVPIRNAFPADLAQPREEWLAESCRVAQLDYLLAVFEDSGTDFLVRAHAPTSLVALLRDLPSAVHGPMKLRLARAFLDRLRGRVSEPREVVQGCIIALGQLGDADAESVDRRIREALLDVEDYVADPLGRRLARIALAEVAGRPGEGPEPGSGRAEIQRELVAGLTGGTSERPWSALALGVLGRGDVERGGEPPESIRSAILSALEDAGTPVDLGAFAIAAGMIGLEEAQPVMQDKLAKLNVDEARGYVVLAMGLLGRRDSIAQVQEIVKESRYRPTLLRQAAVALGLMGDKRLVPDLVDMMAESHGLATQAATASALGFIGDSRSIDPLLEMLTDADSYTDTARGFAAVSLGLVADDSKLPWNATFARDINYRAVTPTLNDEFGTGLLNIL